ncbi:unnamed protein product, partial [Tilletia controversa]
EGLVAVDSTNTDESRGLQANNLIFVLSPSLAPSLRFHRGTMLSLTDPPAFGEDDHRIAVANNIITRESAPPCPLDDASRFTSDVPEYQGQFIKDADKNIIKDLKAAGRLIVKSQLMHSYPFCWRSKQPLIYKAIPAWFVRVEPVVDQLVKNNQETHWVPGAVHEGRFGNWLANARDWNVSRNR